MSASKGAELLLELARIDAEAVEAQADRAHERRFVDETQEFNRRLVEVFGDPAAAIAESPELELGDGTVIALQYDHEFGRGVVRYRGCSRDGCSTGVRVGFVRRASDLVWIDQEDLVFCDAHRPSTPTVFDGLREELNILDAIAEGPTVGSVIARALLLIAERLP